MTIDMPEELVLKLTEAAREEGKTESDLILEAVQQLLHLRRATANVPIPRFARRVGPLAYPAEGSAARPGA
jgi:metal-responsive CopG/Arc/MetJ family transcriptional regulator